MKNFKKLTYMLLAIVLCFALVPSAVFAGSEAEPNNSVNQATNISLNEIHAGKIESSNDIDYYAFTLSNKGSVSFTFNYTNGTPGHRIRLYDSSNNEIQNVYLYQTDTILPYTTDKVRLPAGTYYIRIERAYNDAFNDYSLRINYVDESAGYFESETNNAVNQATSMTNGQPVVGNIQNSGDIDYYSFTLNGNGSLNLAFNYKNGVPGHRIRLYDSSSNEIQNIYLYQADTVLPYTMTKLRLSAGTYYIRIERAYNDSFNDYTIKYEFTDETGRYFEKESNDSANTASTIYFNTEYVGNIQSSSDKDYYSFAVAQNQSISLTFDYKSGTGHRIRLFDSGNKEIQNTYIYQADTIMPFTTNEVSVTAGTYYILIERAYNDSFDDYTIKVNGTGTAAPSPSPVPNPIPTPVQNPEPPPLPSYTPNVSFTNQREAEPNNAINQATGISPNTNVTGKIESSKDVDYYVFNLTNKGSVSFTFDYTNGTPGHRIRLCDSNGNEIQNAYIYQTSTILPCTLDKIRLSAGIYYLRIERAYNDAFNDYTIRVNYTDESAGVFESEKNNAINQATPLTNGQVMTGNIQSSNDVDYYRFTLNGNGSLNLTFNYTGGTPGHRIRIFDDSDSEIQNIYLYQASTILPYTLDKLRLPAGTYYIRIERAYNDAFNDYTIKYDFTDETGRYFEKEYDGTANQANVIYFNTDYTGNIQSSSDRDYYKFTVSQNQSISLTFNYNSGTPGHRIRIYGSSKEYSNTYIYQTSTVLPYTINEISVTVGTYYICIERAYNDSFNDYTIKLNGVGIAAPEPPPITPDPPPVTPNPPPSDGKIGGFQGETVELIGIRLQWTPIDGSVGYRVYRSEIQGDLGIPATDFPSQFHEFVDVNVKPNTTYYYTVKQIVREATIYGDPEVFGAETAQIQARTPDKILGDDLNRPDPGAVKKVMVMKIDDPLMTMADGTRQEIDPGRGTVPLIRSNRTLVPIRAIVEGIGGTVGWDANTSEVSLIYGSNTVRMWVDNKIINVNGSSKELDVAPTIINGRTMIPIRGAIENLGCAVEFIGSTRQVVIVYY